MMRPRVIAGIAFAGVALAGVASLVGPAPAPALVATPTPAPSFDITATITATTAPHLDVPGEEAMGGGSYVITGPDGTQYRVYEQTNRILGTGPTPTPAPTVGPSATPTPAPTIAPTPSPSLSPTPTPAPVISSFDDPAFTYFGTWGYYTGSGKFGTGDHYSADITSSYGFLFTGTAVTLYTQTAPWMAIVSASVDGGPGTEFDAYAAGATQGVAFFRSGSLAPGVHRVIVHHTGRWNPAASEHQMTVDRADITDGAIIPALSP